MGNKNQSLLLIIVFLLFALSGFLFFKGLKAGEQGIRNTPIILETSPSPVLPDLDSVQGEATSASEASSSAAIKVSKVVDGDTIEVIINGKKESIRFIGVNTPETVDPRRPVQCFGKESSDETKGLLFGKEVVLEKDISERDKYNRLLRYIYVKTDNGLLFVNDYLVREGFAQVSTYPPDVKYEKQFSEAQARAKEQGKGLWGRCK